MKIKQLRKLCSDRESYLAELPKELVQQNYLRGQRRYEEKLVKLTNNERNKIRERWLFDSQATASNHDYYVDLSGSVRYFR